MCVVKTLNLYVNMYTYLTFNVFIKTSLTMETNKQKIHRLTSTTKENNLSNLMQGKAVAALYTFKKWFSKISNSHLLNFVHRSFCSVLVIL